MSTAFTISTVTQNLELEVSENEIINLTVNETEAISITMEHTVAQSIAWGDIGGTITDQTDLKTELDAKVNLGSKSSGQYSSGIYSSTVNINWNNSNVPVVQLVSGSNTITFTNPLSGGRYLLILKQPATGAAGTVTFPTIKWCAGTAPTLTATNGKIDLITIIYNDVNSEYYGNYSLNY